MEFSSINIQGNIVSSEILDKIRNEDIKYQLASDFGLDKKTTVRDEIGIAWAAARAHYTAFKLRVERIKEGDSGASETRNSWMLPLLRELGYDVEKASAFIHPDTQKTYAISHKAANLGGFPIHIMGIHDDLDRRRENSGPRLSPHALAQEFLNNTEHTYALVTNGQYLRLLRDATRLVRLSYLEFDLQKMMEEELYADFAIFFRLLHASRMPKNSDNLEESYIEFYHQESLASGSRIREKLSEAVENSIKTLANGFLKHPANTELRSQVQAGSLSSSDFYLHQLRLIYRFLFLIVTEERNLIYPDSKDDQIQRKRKIYYDYYSIERLRKLAAKLHYVDGRKHDLWEGLKATFLLFEKGYYGEKLAIKPLGSGLFAGNALGSLQVIKLDNESLLKVIRFLTLFENDQKQWVRVNYSDLDVEEFGSVYEGLLEFTPTFGDVIGSPSFGFKKKEGGREFQSHYTPEELVKPLIKHSLDYLIEDKLKEADPETALLKLKVADVACGSGHILLSAARRIAFEVACIRETKAGGGKDRVEQPSPKYVRNALRDVIKNCIYGVDKNPLAVELCKVALWLEAHNPGEPLNFLDHHIKCGDAIVGLAHKEEMMNGISDEAFKAIAEEEKEVNYEIEDRKGNRKPSTVAAAFAKRNKLERDTRGQAALDFEGTVLINLENVLKAFKDFEDLPESTPEQIEEKEKAYRKLSNSGALQRLKILADVQVSQFFIKKTLNNKDKLVTDAQYFRYLKGEKPIPQIVLAETINLSDKKFFHWFLEFPEVFQQGGFDIILGNPPYQKAQSITVDLGKAYYEFIKLHFHAGGLADLIVYFLLRDYVILNKTGVLGLITTNSVSQGDSEKFGFNQILEGGGKILFANKNQKWPGKAAVYVSLFTLSKEGNIHRIQYLNNKVADGISSNLEEGNAKKNIYSLETNSNKCFVGTYVLGDGFFLTEKEAEGIIHQEKESEAVIFPFIGGIDLNSNFEVKPSCYIINFFSLTEEQSRKYLVCFDRINQIVRPVREKVNRESYRKNWWQFAEKRKELYTRAAKSNFCLAVTKTGKYFNFVKIPKNYVFDQSLTVLPVDNLSYFPFLQSSIHEAWFTYFGSTLKTDRRYSPAEAFETFPFPDFRGCESELTKMADEMYGCRENLLKTLEIGLTKLYNLFHIQDLNINHIDKVCKCGSDKASKAINMFSELRHHHKLVDEKVKELYGWNDIQLEYGFYEVDYLSENDRVRYTINPNSRKEILNRLLDLNHKIYEKEISEGLHDIDAVEKFYKQKGEPVPAELLLLLGKNKKEKAAKAKQEKASKKQGESVYKQPGLFGEENLFSGE